MKVRSQHPPSLALLAGVALLVLGSAQVSTAQVTMTIVLEVQPNPAFLGTPVLLIASVFGQAWPTGTVSFWDGGQVLETRQFEEGGTCSIQVVPGGPPGPEVCSRHALFTISTLPVGTHTVTATYSGDGGTAPGTSDPVLLEVRLADPVPALDQWGAAALALLVVLSGLALLTRRS
jgi:hypothetical protein